jgi:GTPase
MTHRAGFVALVGRPNVGKSTLLNAFLGEKVAITSAKPQTTRTRIQGIVTRESHQIVFVDTPGVCDTGTALRRAMRRIAGETAASSDVTLVIIELRKGAPAIANEDRELVKAALEGTGKVVVAINKVDLVWPKEQLLPWIAAYAKDLGVDTVVVPISAMKEDGLRELEKELVARLPESPALFPPDMHTDVAERFLCEELIREQLLRQTHQEVPHGVAVVIETFEDERTDDPKRPGLVRLEGRIYVEKESQKPIVIGRGGARIKSLSEQARKEIEPLLGCKVYLRLTVHVDEDWTKNEHRVRHYGLGGETT